MKQTFKKILSATMVFSLLITMFTISFTAYAAGENTLSGITVSEGFITPSFNALRETYTSAFVYEIESVQISAVKTDPAASMTINGTTAGDNQPVNISLNPGDNSVNIVVTPVGGSGSKTYTVTVKRYEIPTQDVEVASPGSIGNLIQNPGFESYTVGISDPNKLWTGPPWNGNSDVTYGNYEAVGSYQEVKGGGTQDWYYGPPSFGMSNQVTSVKYQRSGKWAVRVGGRGKWNDYTSAVSGQASVGQVITQGIVPGQRYVYSVWMKLEQGSWGPITITPYNGTTALTPFLSQTMSDRRDGSDTDNYEADVWYNFKGIVTMPSNATSVRFAMMRGSNVPSDMNPVHCYNSPIYDDFMFTPVCYEYVEPSNIVINSINFSHGTLDPVFSNNVNSYNLTLAYSESAVDMRVVPQTADDILSVKVNGMDIGVSGAPHRLDFPVGVTDLTVLITGKDYSESTYTVKVIRKDATLESVDGEFYTIFKEEDITKEQVTHLTVTRSNELAATGTYSLKCVPTKADWNNSFLTPFTPVNLAEVYDYAALQFKVRFTTPIHAQDAMQIYLHSNDPLTGNLKGSTIPVIFSDFQRGRGNDLINKDLVNTWQTVEIPLSRFNTQPNGQPNTDIPVWANINGFKLYFNTERKANTDIIVYLDDIVFIDKRTSVTLKSGGTEILNNSSVKPGTTTFSVEFGEAMQTSTLDSDYISLTKNGQVIDNINYTIVGNNAVTLTLPEQIEMFGQYTLTVTSKNASGFSTSKIINFIGEGTGLGVKTIVYKKGTEVITSLVPGALTAEVYLSNNTASPMPVQAFLAHYDSKNRLINFGTIKATVPANNTNYKVNVNLNVDQVKVGDKAVVMIWDSIETMSALTGQYTLPSN